MSDGTNGATGSELPVDKVCTIVRYVVQVLVVHLGLFLCCIPVAIRVHSQSRPYFLLKGRNLTTFESLCFVVSVRDPTSTP